MERERAPASNRAPRNTALGQQTSPFSLTCNEELAGSVIPTSRVAMEQHDVDMLMLQMCAAVAS